MNIGARLLEEWRKGGVVRLQQTAYGSVNGIDRSREIRFTLDFLLRLNGNTSQNQAMAGQQKQDPEVDAPGSPKVFRPGK